MNHVGKISPCASETLDIFLHFRILGGYQFIHPIYMETLNLHVGSLGCNLETFPWLLEPSVQAGFGSYYIVLIVCT